VLNGLEEIPAIGFRLGYIGNYYYGAEFARLMEDPPFATHLEDAATYAINIRKLLAGRIDGFIVDDVGVMGSEAAALGVLDQIERYPLAIASKDLHFMFSRASVDPVLVTAINRSLAAMKADGRLQAITDRFLEMAPRVVTGAPEATNER
jgi:polar amino acid transport system substrate-binding protein